MFVIPPKEIEIDGIKYEIRSDYRACIDIMIMLEDDELNDYAKAIALLKMFYVDYGSIPINMQQEAIEYAIAFLSITDIDDDGSNENSNNVAHVKVVDWNKDQTLYIQAVNKIVGRDIRFDDYMHFWTFFGYYREIGECLFTQVITIRYKLAGNQKLEKHEEAFYYNNKEMIDIKSEPMLEDPAWLDKYKNKCGD